MNNAGGTTSPGTVSRTFIQWTAINTLPIRERQGGSCLSPTPSSSPIPTSRSTPTPSSTRRNDLFHDDILNGDLTCLDSDTVFWFAQIYTSKEIVAKINSHHAQPVINEDAFGLRLTRALTKVAKTQGRSRNEIKTDLTNAREMNGVFARVKSAISTSAKAAKASRKVRSGQASSSPETEGDKGADSSPDLKGESSEADDPEAEQRRAALREESEELIKAGSAHLLNDRLIKVAGVFTVAEIVEKANTVDETMILSNRLLSERLWRATKVVAERDGKSREQVKAELDAVRRQHGVGDRKVAYASAKRWASQATKRAGTPTVNSDAMDVDDSTENQENETDDENPLGDLEEMSHRAFDGTLDDDDEDEEPISNERATRPVSPAPFDGSPVGYHVHSDHYLPGFRVY